MSIRYFINRNLFTIAAIVIGFIITFTICLFITTDYHQKKYNQFIWSIYQKNISYINPIYWDKKDKFGRPPLLLMVFIDSYKDFRFLIGKTVNGKQIDINCKDENGTPLLFHVIKHKDIRFLEALLSEKRLNLYIKDMDGNDAIITCVVMNKLEYLELIIQSGGAPKGKLIKNKEGKTALDYAKQYGNKKLVDRLHKLLEDEEYGVTQIKSLHGKVIQ